MFVSYSYLDSTKQKYLKLVNGNEDPSVFKRSPKFVGLVGMVIKTNEIFYSNYFTEAMLYDEDSCKVSYVKNTNKPCSVIWVPINSEYFTKPVGAILLVDKINLKPISDKDLGRVIALKNLVGAQLENIWSMSSAIKTRLKIKKPLLKLNAAIEKLEENSMKKFKY